MGVVFRALDRRKQEAQDRDPYVAIKILSNEFKAHPQSFVALQREARKSQTLAHPNVITVYDFDRDGEIVYMTMEELKGKPLDAFIREYPRGVARGLALQIIKSIAQGLEYAHSKKIVHSDLKPGNVFITNDNHIKILDFGIARAVSSLSEDNGESADGTVFDAQELGGLTPTYASNEMFLNAEPHPSDDIFALGLIGYELLTGIHPYGRKPANRAVAEKLEAKKIKSIKPHQARALLESIALRREDRIADAHVFLAKFDKTSITKKSIAAVAVVAIAVVVLGYWAGLIQNEIVLEPTTVLESPLREEVLRLLAEGDEALSLGPELWNVALSTYDKAWALHPRNIDARAGLDAVVENILNRPQQGSAAEVVQYKLDDINYLLEYPSLAENAELIKLRDSLQKQPIN
jgi:serine/threonine protein kinase